MIMLRPPRFICRLLGVLVLAGVFSACRASAEDQGFLVPYTDIHSVELIYSDKLPQHYFISRTDGYRICRKSVTINDGKPSLINHILATNSMLLGAEGECKITFLKDEEGIGEYDVKIKEQGCQFFLNLEERSVDHIYVLRSDDNIVQFDKCLYRIGLFSIGFNGALDIEDSRLFVPRSKSFWGSYQSGPEYVPMVQALMDLCDFKMQQFDSIEEVAKASRNVKCGKIK